MNIPSTLEDIVLTLPTIRDKHKTGTRLYTLLKRIARKEVENLFSVINGQPKQFGPFRDIVFPYFKMGVIDSLNLFDIDELIIFSFYWSNKGRYHNVLDIGANIGLHSIVLSKCGYIVRSYEPDPIHFDMLEKNVSINKCTNVQAFNSAVSDESGQMEFVRVLGNTTGSHLAGSKANPYGDLKRFPVKVESILPLIKWADLIKLDAEGHEKKILLATNHDHWIDTDALVEVENAGNAGAIYEHFKNLKVNLFSQKNNWSLVHGIRDIPNSYHEGTLFITCKEEMPWITNDY